MSRPLLPTCTAMLVETFLQTRSDRLIAIGRAIIAAFALAAIWIDPSQPALAPDLTYGLLAGYVAFALAVVFATWRERVHAAEIAVGAHLVDLAVYSTLMFLTEGPTSPFFLLFTFSMVSAAFRWQWRGALWTAIAVLVTLVAIYGGLASAVKFDTDRFIIRCAYVVVIGAMLVYFGFRYQRMAEEDTRLAAWHPDPAADRPALLRDCLLHVVGVFAAPHAVLLIQERDEPWGSVTAWKGGEFRQERLVEGSLESIVPEALADAGFICNLAGDVLVANGAGRLSLWQGPPLAGELAVHGLERVLSVPIHSNGATGRLFVAGRNDFSREDLTLAWLVAAQIAVEFDRIQVIEGMQQSAATEERLRLARDLHDGILQTLAGTALQLESVKQLASRDPAAVRAKIDSLQAWLAHEQREMRGFIGKLQPATAPSGMTADPSDIASLVAKLEQQWSIAIKLSLDSDLRLPADLEFHAHHLVREAVANAVRHGKASAITLQARANHGHLDLTIADNGGGLPERGQFEASQCEALHIGPRSLRERIASLGGTLVVDSSSAGVTLSIALPLKELSYSP
jgi:signal transduction histidine kinase